METIGPIKDMSTGRVLLARDFDLPSKRSRALIASKSKKRQGKIKVGLYPPMGHSEIEYITLDADHVVITRDATA